MNDRSLMCPGCGASNAGEATSCQACGANLNPNLPVPATIRIPIKREESRREVALRGAGTGLALHQLLSPAHGDELFLGSAGFTMSR